MGSETKTKPASKLRSLEARRAKLEMDIAKQKRSTESLRAWREGQKGVR